VKERNDERLSAGGVEEGYSAGDNEDAAHGYVHGRDRGTRCRIGVLLSFKETELGSKFVAAEVLAIARGCHLKTQHVARQKLVDDQTVESTIMCLVKKASRSHSRVCRSREIVTAREKCVRVKERNRSRYYRNFVTFHYH
jgi:hypothetical protein